MSEPIVVALIGALVTISGSVLSFLASRIAKTMQSIESRIERVEGKIDDLGEGQALIRERLAHLEGQRDPLLRAHPG